MTTNNLTDTIRKAEAEFEKIVEGRRLSKYHKNYIATHIVKSHIKSTQLDVLKAVEEGVVEKLTQPNYENEMRVAFSSLKGEHPEYEITEREAISFGYRLVNHLRSPLLAPLRQAKEELTGNK